MGSDNSKEQPEEYFFDGQNVMKIEKVPQESKEGENIPVSKQAEEVLSLSRTSLEKYLPNNYASKKKIGEGAYGEVFRAVRKSDGQVVAIKKIEKNNDAVQKIGILPKEYVVMKRLEGHPGIARVFDLEEDKNYFYFIMEYYPGGDLFDFQDQKYPDGMPSEMVLHFAVKILDAVQYCHQKDVAHRDIKLENIFLKDKSDYPDIALADFGLSSPAPIDSLLYDYPGSPYYAAPELILGNPYRGDKADIWAVGVCLYSLFTGSFPFFSKNQKELFNQITKLAPRMDVPGTYSVQCRTLIEWMLTKNPAGRPSISTIKDTKCYKEHADPEEMEISYDVTEKDE